MFGVKEKTEEPKKDSVEYADYEIVRKSKVGDFLRDNTEFFIVDMDKKKVYCSSDLRMREISEKIDNENTFVIKKASYSI